MAIFNSHVSLPEGIAFLMRKLVCCKEPIFCPSPWSTMWWFFMADYLGSRLWSVMGAVILGTLKRKDRSAPSCTQTRIHTYLFIYIIMLIKTNIIIYIIINTYLYIYMYTYTPFFSIFFRNGDPPLDTDELECRFFILNKWPDKSRPLLRDDAKSPCCSDAKWFNNWKSANLIW